MHIPVYLEPQDCQFPDSRLALQEPNGLLAIGGSLDPCTLLKAYRLGIFPWYSDGQPLLWWSPDPRAVLFPQQLHLSRSLKKTLKNTPFKISINQSFEQVIQACAKPRNSPPQEAGTWITRAMITAYSQLHKLGHAHSVEVWLEGQLVGGLYGLALGKVFFGESMFHHQRDASKIAFVYLVRHLITQDFRLIDCQQTTSHLTRLGATTLSRNEFTTLLKRYCDADKNDTHWPKITGKP